MITQEKLEQLAQAILESAKQMLREWKSFNTTGFAFFPDGKMAMAELRHEEHYQKDAVFNTFFAMAKKRGADAVVVVSDARYKFEECKSEEKKRKIVEQLPQGSIADDPDNMEAIHLAALGPAVKNFSLAAPYVRVDNDEIVFVHDDRVPEGVVYGCEGRMAPKWEEIDPDYEHPRVYMKEVEKKETEA